MFVLSTDDGSAIRSASKVTVYHAFGDGDTLLLLSPQSHLALRGPQGGRARNALWAALAGCIMPPNLFGHTMSGLHVRQAAVAGVASSQDPFHEL